MRIDLRDILRGKTASMPFDFEMDTSGLAMGSVERFDTPLRVKGTVEDHAGTLTVTARLTGDMRCVCARCLREFPMALDMETSAFLAEELEDEGNVDYYLLDDGFADLEEIAGTAVVLNMEQRLLCREDCKGLCPKCGKDLNDGPCGCGEDQDPRWAALRGLFGNENDQEV